MKIDYDKKYNFWIDDIRPAPEGWIHIRSVNEFIDLWTKEGNLDLVIDTISLDHDAGDFCKDGGDYIKILDFLDYQFNTFFKDGGWNYNIRFHLHSSNPTGVLNMRRIIQKNGWNEVQDIS